jgi:hypothetical protein
MTDRHAGYIVTLAEDIREDDAEAVLTALRMVSGVVSVTPLVSDYTFAIARERRDRVWAGSLRDLVRRMELDTLPTG